jgi:RNA polymerase sigma-70 factor, ECF subfamily
MRPHHGFHPKVEGERAVALPPTPRWTSPAADAGLRAKQVAVAANLSAVVCNRELMDDDELIRRLAGGDDTALRELFGRHAPMLAVRLRAVLPPSDVEDVLQETFLAAWKGAGSYRPQDKAGGWLWGIGRRQAALLLRRRGPATADLHDFLEPGTTGGVADSCFPGDPAQLVTTAFELASAVGALSPADRQVWQLMYVEDRPVAEVARLTGVPEGTVKSRAHRARRLLRAALGGGLG